MKKLIFILFGIYLLIGSLCFAGTIWWFGDDDIYTTEIDDAINTEKNPGEEIINPIREGSYKVVNADDGSNEINNIIRGSDEIRDHWDAIDETLALVKRIINYALSIVSLIALIYMLYHGFLIVTAAGDDWQYKKGLWWIKFGAIALAGIGTSRLVVSFIIWIITNILD